MDYENREFIPEWDDDFNEDCSFFCPFHDVYFAEKKDEKNAG